MGVEVGDAVEVGGGEAAEVGCGEAVDVGTEDEEAVKEVDEVSDGSSFVNMVRRPKENIVKEKEIRRRKRGRGRE